MGKRVITELIDDLDGSTLGDDAETIEFSIQGERFEIDLSAENADAFRDALALYVNAARPLTATTRSARRSAGNSMKRDLSVVREWARANGQSVSDRGRVPEAVLAAYDAANR